MTPRERILTALAHKTPDRVPRMMGYYVGVSDIVRQRAAPTGLEETFGIETRVARFEATQREADFERYLKALPPNVRVGDLPTLRRYSEWGYAPPGLGGPLKPEVTPLADARRHQDIGDYRFPDVTAGDRSQRLKLQVDAWKERGFAVIGHLPGLGGCLFETAWRVRGFNRFLRDLTVNKELPTYLLDQVAAMGASNAAILARSGVDILGLGDDVAEPSRMLLSPKTWGEFFKPRLAEIIRAAKEVNPRIHVFYHSDGNLEAIIPGLLEVGVDILEPVQPDCMEPEGLKERFGEKLTLWGTVGSAQTWAHGSPEDMRREVGHRIETLREQGGFIIAPAYDIEPDVPTENIHAFFKAVEEFGAQ